MEELNATYVISAAVIAMKKVAMEAKKPERYPPMRLHIANRPVTRAQAPKNSAIR